MIESQIFQLVRADHDQFDAVSFWKELQKLQWIKSKATWTTLWWRTEEAFVAPWASNDLNRDMVLGQDFFWNLLDIASFVKAQNKCDILINRPQCSFPVKEMVVNYCSKKWTIQRRIQDIVATVRKIEFAKLFEMLQIAGWRIFDEEQRYIPPWNLSDHFRSREDIVSYLVKNGANPPENDESKMDNSDPDTGNESDALSTKENDTFLESSCSLATFEHHKSRPKAKYFTPTSALNTTMESMESNCSMIENSASLIGFYQAYENVLALIKCTKPEMVTIKKTLIEECGWKVIYSTVQRTSYILAPWIQNQDNFAVWRAGNTADFQHLSDYFLDNKNDEIKLLEALQSEYFQKKCGDFIVAHNPGKESAPKEMSPFELRNLSPQRPLLHARDPSTHTDRLVPTTSAATPQIDINDSEFHFSEDDYVFGDDDDLLAEAEPSSSSSENNTTTLYNLLCSSSVKFSEVYNELKSMEPPWTCVYSDPESHSHLEVNIEGSSRIYLRPLKKVSDRNMIFNEDYFYSEAALIRYLKLNYGIETLHIDTKEDEDALQKRRPGRRSSRANETDSIAGGSVCSVPPSAEKLVKRKKSEKSSIVRKATTVDPSNEVIDAIQLLRGSVNRNLQVVRDYFRPLGWDCISEKHSKLNNKVGAVGYTEYIVAPWAKEGIIEESVNYSRIDRNRFVENVDFFDIRNNREAFCDYLQENGFQRIVEPVAVPKGSVQKQRSKSKTKPLQDSKMKRPSEIPEEDSEDELLQSREVASQKLRYDVGTDEYLLVQYLKETPPSFGKIKDVLSSLGWRLVYETTSKEEKKIHMVPYFIYLLAPSAKTRDGGYEDVENKKNFVVINRKILKEGTDFFRADEKEKLYGFLRENGFSDKNIKKVEDSKPSRSTSVTAAERPRPSDKGYDKTVKKERLSLQPQPVPVMPILSNPFEVDTHEYRLAQYLNESPQSFAKVMDALDALGWKIVYETTPREKQRAGGDFYVAYCLAPSANEKEGGYKQAENKKNNTYVTIDRTILKENVDFFNLDEKKALYDFLLCHGFAMKKVVESNDSKSPRSITASISPEHLPTNTTAQGEAISDLIASNALGSDEIAILHRLINPEIQHSLIWEHLQSLGWFHVKESISIKYYVAPWARDLDNSLTDDTRGGIVVLDRAKLSENDDFFNSAEVDKLYRYLVEFKFSRRPDTTASSSKGAVEDTKSVPIKSSKAAKKSAVQAAVAPNRYLKEEEEEAHQHVEHLGVILSEGTPEYDIAVELSKPKPSPGKVWNRLESLGWYIIYESYDDKYYIAPWVEDEILHREKVYKVIDKSKLVENVDFFPASNLPQLYDYLRKHDFSKKVDSVHSSEPELVSREISRLESLGLRARTAVAKESQSQSHPPGRGSEKLPTKTTKVATQPSPCVSTQSHVSDDYIYDRESVDYFANSSSSEKARSVNISQDSSPSTKSSDSESNSVDGNNTFDSDEYLALQCLKEEPVYYPKVWRFLSNLGWSTMYERGREDCYYVAPWAWDGITRGVSKYIVIDRSKVSENVDYFPDRESVYNHIRKIGFRRTPQDQVYVRTEAVRVNVKRKMVATHDSSDDRTRNTADSSDEVDPVPVKTTVEKKHKKQRKHSAMGAAVEVPPSPIVVPPREWTLRENIEQVYPSFLTEHTTSSVGSEHTSSGAHTNDGSSPIQTPDRPLANTVISRDAEREELSSIIKGALVKAEGCSVYLCGNPGTGKTITANSVIQSLSSSLIPESSSSSSSSHEDERRGFKVLKLVGTTFTSSAEVFREIARLLGKLRHGDSDETAKRTVVDHFRTQARKVNFDSCNHGSSPVSQGSGDEASVSIGSKKKRSPSDAGGKVLMTVLLLDEIDLCKKEAMKDLLLLTSSTSASFPSEQVSDGDDERSEKSSKKNRDDEASSHREKNGQIRARYSSLILIGIGNVINWHETFQLPHYCIVKKIIFRVYNNETMMAIVNHHTRNLLHASSAAMLIARILNYRNGDIRALVAVAVDSVKFAVKELLKEHGENISTLQKVLDENSSPIVKITHMKSVCDKVGLSPNCVELEQLDIIGSLSAMQHLFLVSLYVGSGTDVALNMKIRAMHQMFQSYAEQKHVLDETITLDATKSFVEVLVNYNLMTALSAHKVNSSKFPDQVSYSLKFPAATLLKYPQLAQMHKVELQRCLALRAQE